MPPNLVQRMEKGRGTGRHGSAPAGPQVVGMPGLQAGPLDDGTSIGTVVVFPPLLQPAARRVFPPLLPPVDCQVEQGIAVVHRLHAGLELPSSWTMRTSFPAIARNSSTWRSSVPIPGSCSLTWAP